MPKLSVITINFNNASGLRKTIESVVSQTFTDYEYIIIDGGSTDGSVDIIKEYTDKIEYWVSEADKGIYNAMNKGILKSKGEYLQFLNSGDWLVNENVLNQIFRIEHNEDILYGDIILWYNKSYKKLKSYFNKEIDLLFLFKSTLTHQNTFIKRILFKTKLYDENLMIVSDWKFFLEKIVLESCSLFYIRFPVAYYDMSGISSKPESNNLLKEEREKVLQSLFPPMILLSMKKFVELQKFKPIIYVIEINKYKGFRYLMFGFIRISLRTYQRFLKLFGVKI